MPKQYAIFKYLIVLRLLHIFFYPCPLSAEKSSFPAEGCCFLLYLCH